MPHPPALPASGPRPACRRAIGAQRLIIDQVTGEQIGTQAIQETKRIPAMAEARVRMPRNAALALRISGAPCPTVFRDASSAPRPAGPPLLSRPHAAVLGVPAHAGGEV